MMNKSLRILLLYMLTRKIIGAKHMPEYRIVKSVLKNQKEKMFDKEYKKIINEGLIIRLKKRTGKGSDWHVSINPRKIKEIMKKVNKNG